MGLVIEGNIRDPCADEIFKGRGVTVDSLKRQRAYDNYQLDDIKKVLNKYNRKLAIPILDYTRSSYDLKDAFTFTDKLSFDDAFKCSGESSCASAVTNTELPTFVSNFLFKK